MIRTFDGAIRSLREVQATTTTLDGSDKAKLEAVIVFIDAEVRETVREAATQLVEDLILLDTASRIVAQEAEHVSHS